MDAGFPSTLIDPSLFKIALQYSPNAIALCETVYDGAGTPVDFRYLLINKRYEEFSNQRKEALYGQLATDLLPNALKTGIWQQALRVVLTGQTYREELYYTTQAGYSGWFDVSITSWDKRGIVISFMEVSEQKARLLAERQQSNFLHEVVHNSLNGIWVVEPIRNQQAAIIDFRFVLVNQVGLITAGLSADQFSQTTLLTLFPTIGTLPFPGADPSRNQTIFERYVEIVSTGIPTTFDVDYQYDGLSGWFWVAVNKLNDGLMLTFRDIADLKQAQQQLERTNRELRQTNQNLEQFAYVSSHDLQEPLRKIQSFGDLLTTRLGDSADKDISDIVRRMTGSAKRMQGLVKDLLAYSRLTTRQEDFGLVLLNRVLTESLDDLQPLTDEKQAIIEADALPTVPGNANQLRQLFFCLIHNALKFHKPGMVPKIDISAVLVEPTGLPPILSETGRQYIAVSIDDNGIGFDEKYTDRIFTIFQRLHGRGRYEGTGIGLALARKITENHGGTLTARSRLNQGSVFTAWLSVD
jgi:signal transduction histidine kinase